MGYLQPRLQQDHLLEKKAEECPSERPLKMIMKEFINSPTAITVNGNDLDNFSKAIRRVRLDQYGAHPIDLTDTIDKLTGIKDNDSQRESALILHVEQDIVMLGTEDSLLQLGGNNVTVLGDGTFKYCPKCFHQLPSEESRAWSSVIVR